MKTRLKQALKGKKEGDRLSVGNNTERGVGE